MSFRHPPSVFNVLQRHAYATWLAGIRLAGIIWHFENVQLSSLPFTHFCVMLKSLLLSINCCLLLALVAVSEKGAQLIQALFQ